MNKPVNILSLILDDDKDILEIIEDLLKENAITNYRLFSLYDEFLNDMTDEMNVSVIDHTLTGGKTGLDICKAVKARNKNNFVIVLTGQINPDVVIDYLNENANRYVDKNRSDYLQKMIEYLKIGIETVKEKLEQNEILEYKIEEIRERRKLYEK